VNPSTQEETVIESGISLIAYPNPTEGRVTINAEGLEEGRSCIIRVLDLNGRLISQEQFEGMERLTEITVDLKEHPAGIYLLMVEQDEQRKFVRIIKQ
jgi:hypothetical protein